MPVGTRSCKAEGAPHPRVGRPGEPARQLVVSVRVEVSGLPDRGAPGGVAMLAVARAVADDVPARGSAFPGLGPLARSVAIPVQVGVRAGGARQSSETRP